MADCPAALNLAGEHFACDWPADDHGKHPGWAHANKDAQAVWTGDEGDASAAWYVREVGNA